VAAEIIVSHKKVLLRPLI